MAEKIEIWKDIDRYEGRYQVSQIGRVRSLVSPHKIYGYVLRKDPLIRSLHKNIEL